MNYAIKMALVSRLMTYICCSYLLHTSRAINFSSFYSWRSSRRIENTAFIFLACRLWWDCQWLCSTSGMFVLTLPAELCVLFRVGFFFKLEVSINIDSKQSNVSHCVSSIWKLLHGFFERFVLLFLKSHFLFSLYHLGDIPIYWVIFSVFEMSFCVM